MCDVDCQKVPWVALVAKWPKSKVIHPKLMTVLSLRLLHLFRLLICFQLCMMETSVEVQTAGRNCSSVSEPACFVRSTGLPPLPAPPPTCVCLCICPCLLTAPAVCTPARHRRARLCSRSWQSDCSSNKKAAFPHFEKSVWLNPEYDVWIKWVLGAWEMVAKRAMAVCLDYY